MILGVKPVLGLLVFRILLGKSWPERSPARTHWKVLSSPRAGSFIGACSPTVRQTPYQVLWAGRPGVETSALVCWRDKGLQGPPQRALTQLGAALCRKEPRRAVGASGRLRPREGRRLFPGRPPGPWHAGLDSLPPSPCVCASPGGGNHCVTRVGLHKLFTCGCSWGGHREGHSASLCSSPTPVPPTFRQAPRGSQDAVLVRAGDKAILSCETDSFPEPTVTWYKDGQPLVLAQRTQTLLGGQRLEILNTQVSSLVAWAAVSSCEGVTFWLW